MSSNVWLQIDSSAVGDTWIRSNEVSAVTVTTRAAYRDRHESYGVSVARDSHDRTITSDLATGIKSRAEAMSVVRRILQLMASPPDVVGLIRIDGASVTFESMAD